MLKQNVGLILNLGVSLLIHIHPLHPMSALIETAQLRTLKSFPESKTADWIRGSSQDKNPTYGHFDVFTAVFGEFHAGWIFFRSQKKNKEIEYQLNQLYKTNFDLREKGDVSRKFQIFVGNLNFSHPCRAWKSWVRCWNKHWRGSQCSGTVSKTTKHPAMMALQKNYMKPSSIL